MRLQNCKKWLISSSCVSVCPSAWNNPASLSWNLIFEYFLKICQENSSFIKIWQEKWVLYRKVNIHFLSYLAQFLEWRMFQTKFVGKIKTHIICSIPPKIVPLWQNVEKYARTGQATDGNMAYVYCMLDN